MKLMKITLLIVMSGVLLMRCNAPDLCKTDTARKLIPDTGNVSFREFVRLFRYKPAYYSMKENVCKTLQDDAVYFQDIDELVSFFNQTQPAGGKTVSKGQEGINGKLFYDKIDGVLKIESSKGDFVLSYIDENFVAGDYQCATGSRTVGLYLDLKTRTYLCVSVIPGTNKYIPENVTSVRFLKNDLMPVLYLGTDWSKPAEVHIADWKREYKFETLGYYEYKVGQWRKNLYIDLEKPVYLKQCTYNDVLALYRQSLAEDIRKTAKKTWETKDSEEFNYIPGWQIDL